MLVQVVILHHLKIIVSNKNSIIDSANIDKWHQWWSKNLHQTSLIPVRAATPHGHTNFMSLGRIVVDKTTHHDNSQHIHLQGSNFSGATGVNIGFTTSVWARKIIGKFQMYGTVCVVKLIKCLITYIL